MLTVHVVAVRVSFDLIRKFATQPAVTAGKLVQQPLARISDAARPTRDRVSRMAQHDTTAGICDEKLLAKGDQQRSSVQERAQHSDSLIA